MEVARAAEREADAQAALKRVQDRLAAANEAIRVRLRHAKHCWHVCVCVCVSMCVCVRFLRGLHMDTECLSERPLLSCMV